MERRDFLKAGAFGTLASGFPGMAYAQSGAGDAKLNALLDTLFYDTLDLFPLNATSVGFDKGSHAALRSQLGDFTSASITKSVEWCRSALARVNALSPTTLSDTALRHRELTIWQLSQTLRSASFGLNTPQNPYALSQADGAYYMLPDFLDSMHPVENAEDAEAYLARLGQVGRAIDQNGDYQKEMIARGLIAPGWSLDLVIKQLRALRGSAPEANGLVTSLARRAAAKGLAGDWAGRAAVIVRDKVYPAVDRQIALVESLKAKTPAGDGVWRVKDGDAIYAAALAEATTTSFSPDEVHKIGLAQVAELTARLDLVLRAAGLTQGSVSARLTALNTRPDQLYPNTEAGRAELIASLNTGIQAMRKRLPQAFNDVPTDPLEIRRVPVEIQDGAPNGYYYPAPLDRSRSAIYWINLKDTHNWPKYSLPDLTYHEGLPGHHLQLSYVNHADAVPLLLRNSGNAAYTEGWALYAEELASDLGAFSGVEQAGYLQSLLFRAARLVVDTGIHTKRWSREQATAYMMETTGFPRDRCQSEVERYTCMIGQACSYKIGHNVWIRLRNKARAELGAKFSLGWFHDVLKEGVLPLAMLERRMDERIAQAKA
jgi:uncharacterized protein (DUF885 family)